MASLSHAPHDPVTVGEARSAIQPNNLLKQECAEWAMGWQSEVLVGTSSKELVLTVKGESVQCIAMCASKWIIRSDMTMCDYFALFWTRFSCNLGAMQLKKKKRARMHEQM